MKKILLSFGKQTQSGHLPKIQSRRLQLREFANVAYKSDGKDDDDDDSDTLTITKSIKELGTKNQKANEKLQQSIDSITESVKAQKEEMQKEVKGAKEIAEKATEAIEKLEAKMATTLKVSVEGKKSFFEEFGEKLAAKADALKTFRQEKKGFGAIDLEAKAVGNMGSSTNLTGSYFVTPTVVPGVVTKLYEDVHMRDLIPVGQTGQTNTVRYVQDNGGEGGPTTVAEGATKPQIDRDLQIVDSPVRKIATYFRVPEEMIDDIPYLQSFLGQIGLEEVMVVEDNQILYGDGTGTNLSGFNTQGTAFAAGTSVIGASANEFDVIGAAKKQVRVSKINGALIALINPVDYYNMRYKRKDTTNNYIFQGGGNGLDVGLNVDGVRILEHTGVTAGDFFVFSPRAAAIFDRAGTTVRFYDQDQDNAIKNLITIVIEKRLALNVYRPLGIIKGTFSAAITDLTS
jgi:HK97 family phage major capsid protein